MSTRKRRAGLPDTNVANIDTATDRFGVHEPLRHFNEPAGLETYRIFEKHIRGFRQLTKLDIHPPQCSYQGVRLRTHFGIVMDDQAEDPASELDGELLYQGTVPVDQHIQLAAQMHYRGMRGIWNELQEILQLLRRVDLSLGGQVCLGEAKFRELEQCVISRETLLEQRVDSPEGLVVTICDVVGAWRLAVPERAGPVRL